MKGGTRKRGKTWSYYFDTAQVGGKRKKIEKGGFRTKKEAETALAKAIAEYENSGQVFQPSTISVSDYLDFWYEQCCRMNLSEKTNQTYASIIRIHLKPQLGSYRLSALQAASIQSFVNQLKVDGYAKSTITVICSILSASLNYAVEPLQYIKDNPCRYVKIGAVPKPPRTRIALTNDQFQEIIALYPPGSKYYLPLILGWYCGLRINECLALTWDSIDFKNRTISITYQLSRHSVNRKLVWAVKIPKRDSQREIKFGETLYKILKAEKKRQMENELKYGEYYSIHYLSEFVDKNGLTKTRIVECQKGNCKVPPSFPLVCVDENGKMTTENTFHTCTKNISAALDIDFDYHCLRHTHATKLAEAGVSVKAAQVRLGHKNIATTLKTYVHHTNEMAVEAAEKFEQAVNGLPPK